jgi:hypothetical protein
MMLGPKPGVPISDLCDEQRLPPTVFYCWQKEFFANGVGPFIKGDALLLSRLPSRSKVIVWAATVHTSKDLSGLVLL